jgi:hypothetical protein
MSRVWWEGEDTILIGEFYPPATRSASQNHESRLVSSADGRNSMVDGHIGSVWIGMAVDGEQSCLYSLIYCIDVGTGQQINRAISGLA